MSEVCKLCDAVSTEAPLAQGDGFVVLRASNLKGHKDRVMIVDVFHEALIDGEEGEDEWYDNQNLIRHATTLLFEYILQNLDDGDGEWAIMAPTHASIPDHFHLIATTIDRNSEGVEVGDDVAQIVDTERIKLRFLSRGEQ